MQSYYYLLGSGLYEGEPFSYLWPFSQALAATVSMANVPDREGARAAHGVARNCTRAWSGCTPTSTPTTPARRRHLHEHAAGLRRHGGAARRPRRGEVLRRQRLGRHRADAALRADPRRRLLGSAEGIMAFEMAGWQGVRRTRLSRRHPVLQPDSKTPTATPSRPRPRPSSRCSSTARPATPATCSSPKRPTNGCGAACCSRAGCTPTTSTARAWSNRRSGATTRAAMIGAGTLLYQATGNSAYLYQARQTAKAALAYFTPQRLGEEIPFFPSVYFRNLLYLDSVTHDPPGPRHRPGLRRLRLAEPAPRPTTCSSPARRRARSCSCSRRSCRSTRCSSSPPSTYF